MIYCIGDSFTYGDELPDAGWDNQRPSELAWPSKLSQLTDRPITNLGRKACGNTRIVKRIIDSAFKDDCELVIVAWTNPVRLEFFSSGPYDSWPGRNTKSFDNKAKEVLTKALTIENDVKFDLWAYRKWLRDIILTQNLLDNRGIKHLMFVTFHEWGPIPGTEDLWDKINWNYFLGHPLTSPTCDYETLCYWMADAPKGPNGHPLELGQERIASKINEYIRNFGWVS